MRENAAPWTSMNHGQGDGVAPAPWGGRRCGPSLAGPARAPQLALVFCLLCRRPGPPRRVLGLKAEVELEVGSNPWPSLTHVPSRPRMARTCLKQPPPRQVCLRDTAPDAEAMEMPLKDRPKTWTIRQYKRIRDTALMRTQEERDSLRHPRA